MNEEKNTGAEQMAEFERNQIMQQLNNAKGFADIFTVQTATLNFPPEARLYLYNTFVSLATRFAPPE